MKFTRTADDVLAAALDKLPIPSDTFVAGDAVKIHDKTGCFNGEQGLIHSYFQGFYSPEGEANHIWRIESIKGIKGRMPFNEKSLRRI